MKQRILAILLTIALIFSFGSLPVWAGPAEDGAITLNLENGIITIYPDGYTQGNGEKVSYTGPYVITGSLREDTPLRLENWTPDNVTYDITLFNATIVGNSWCTAIRADGNNNSGSITLNLSSKGICKIQGYNHPAIVQGNQTQLTTNLKVVYGVLTMGAVNCDRHVISAECLDRLSVAGCTKTSDGQPIDNGKNTTFVTTHKFTDNDDGTCTADNCAACGTITIDHDGNGMYRDNADGTHTNYCMACDATLSIDAHNQSGEHVDNGDGTHRIYCSICGAVSVASEVHNQNGRLSNSGDGTHGIHCSDCNSVSATESHNQDGEVIAVNDLYHAVTCSDCGVFSGMLERHNKDGIADSGDGYHTIYCSVCERYIFNEPHRVENYTVVTEPGTDTSGEIEGICADCGAEVSGILSPTGGYWVRLWDSAGDGWEGAELSVMIGTTEHRLTLEDGGEGTFLLPASSDEVTSIIFYKGDYDDECTFELYAPNTIQPLCSRYGIYGMDDVRDGEVLYRSANCADYSGVEAALAAVPVDLSPYTLESIQALLTARQTVKYGLPKSSQATVDGYADAILAAINGLVLDEGTGSGAEPVTLTLQSGEQLVITSTGYRIGDGAETAHTGPYILTSGGQEIAAAVLVESGYHAITLNNLNLKTTDASPFVLAPGTVVKLSVTGENILDGQEADGFAGLNAPDGTFLVLSGTGSLTARGGDSAAGIGGNDGEAAGNTTVISGNVTATSVSDGAGIGGGYEGGAGTIVITGGTVYAECLADDGAGIGCGDDGEGGTITITGGTVTGKSTDDDGAGIGGGDNGGPDSITITDGVIIAEGDDGAGIGDGQSSDGCIITITGGNITATSNDGAGIGAGSSGNNTIVNITGGTIAAASGDGAGIGAGSSSDGCAVTISNGDITAVSEYGAGIGGGNVSGCEYGGVTTVTILDGNVTARSVYGAGIGNGYYSNYYDYDYERGYTIVDILGGMLTVRSDYSVGIGHGYESGDCAVTIADCVVFVEDSTAEDGGEAGIIGKAPYSYSWIEAMRYVTTDNAYIFSSNPDAISPQPKNLEGQPVFHVGATTQREDGYACAVLSDGSRILCYVHDGEISLYLPEGITVLEVRGTQADYTAVDAALAKVPEELSVYTETSVKVLQDAIDHVERGLLFDRQAEVDAMAKAIEDAIAALTYKDADYSKVDEAIAKAEALNAEEYKDFSGVEAAVNAVERGKNITQQTEVDAMAKAIEDAIAALTYKDADYSKVDEAIAKAEALNAEEYKDFSGVEAAVNAVVRGKNITQQAEVDAMAKAIEDAITDLEPIPLTPPETNDNSNYLLWITWLFMSVSVMSAIVYSRKKHGIK